MANKPLYTSSRAEAAEWGENDLWLDSYKENCICARAIELAIRQNYKDNSLASDCAKKVIEEHGFDRVNWVLANTIQRAGADGRYTEENREWARNFHIPNDWERFRDAFALMSHPGLVNGFTNQARREWDSLKLFTREHVYDESRAGIDYTGKIVAVRADVLKDDCKTPENQLLYATGGFGCKPDTLGTKVYGRYLKDGGKDCFRRSEILGVVKLNLLPEWAQEKFAEFSVEETSEQEQTEETMDIGGIKQ
ncbi:MAG: DUF3849 domain-containing protein [Clostridiales bacterium]|nr:DUF3849 domain-containing protein [Clostridiales bacterium]